MYLFSRAPPVKAEGVDGLQTAIGLEGEAGELHDSETSNP